MDYKEQIRQFEEELDRLIDRYHQEYDLDVATLVGCLTLKVQSVSLDLFGAELEELEDGDDDSTESWKD